MDLPLRVLLAAHFIRGSVVSSLLYPRRTSPSAETKPGKAPKNVDYVGARGGTWRIATGAGILGQGGWGCWKGIRVEHTVWLLQVTEAAIGRCFNVTQLHQILCRIHMLTSLRPHGMASAIVVPCAAAYMAVMS